MWWNKKLVQSITLIYIALWQCSSLLIITATNIHLLNLQENKITNNVWYTESSCLLTFTNFFYFIILIYFCKQLHRVPNICPLQFDFFFDEFLLAAKLSNSSSLEELAVFVRSMLTIRFCIAAFSLLDSSISFSISSFPTWLRTVESKLLKTASLSFRVSSSVFQLPISEVLVFFQQFMYFCNGFPLKYLLFRLQDK